MKKDNKALLLKYITCFAIASLIAIAVFWSKGFFGHSTAVNIQILADGFFVSGILLTLFAGMMFVSREGALIGISFVMRNVVLAFILKELKKTNDKSILVTGLFFLMIGIVFTVIWYKNYYNVV